MTSLHWYRLALDLDAAGNFVGISYEVRHADRIVAIHVLPRPAPFSDLQDNCIDLIDDLEQRYGVQLPLW